MTQTPAENAGSVAPASAHARLAPGILALALAWAAVVGSGLLYVASWISGDIAYHRGVAYTMQGANWQGEGPYVDLLTYYGGLYPLILGRIAGALGVTFDTVVSVASWGIAILWVILFWWLGTRVWPGHRLRAAVLALLATTAAPFTNRVLLWVDSPLVSAQNAFPLYPRDLALMLIVVMAGSALARSSRSRVLGIGVAIGGIVVVHLQIALVAGWLVVAAAVVTAAARRDRTPLLEAVGAGLLALVLSAWWWIPRLAATIQSGELLLGGFPGAPPLRLEPGNAVMAFGIVGILALLGFAVAAAGKPLPGRLRLFVVWVIVLLPLVLIDRLVDGSDLLSERRTWLIVSIPLTIFAAATASLVIERLRPVVAAAFVIVVLVGPSIPGTVATVALIRDAWEPGRIGGRVFDASRWDPLLADLNERVQAEGVHVAMTYDAYAAWVWSLSGAQVPSLWLPGPFKLGFDPERMTGTGYLDRLRSQEAAFAGGREQICRLSDQVRAGSVVLDVEDGMVGTLDASPASPFRVDPRDRSVETIERVVAPGVTYVDRGGQDVLRLAAGARWQPPFRAAAPRLLAVEINVPYPQPGEPLVPQPGPLIEVDSGDAIVTFGTGLMPGPARVVVPVSGIDDRVAVTARSEVDLVRFTAFEPLPGLTLPATEGPVRWAPDDFCVGP